MTELKQTTLIQGDPAASVERHTRRWYQEHFGIDPLGLVPCEEVPNPHYRSANPMKLWKERDVYPLRSEEGIRTFRERSDRAKQGFQKRRARLMDWFKDLKTGSPRVPVILQMLYNIGERIRILHDRKAECRDQDGSSDYWETGVEHCERCARWTRQQNDLRAKREKLFEELEEIAGSDKRTIQLARKYLREKEEVET